MTIKIIPASPWVTVETPDGYTTEYYFQVNDVKYFPPDQNPAGDVNIYVTVLDGIGRPLEGIRVGFRFPGETAPYKTTDASGTVSYNMSGDGWFQWDDVLHQPGPYTIFLPDQPDAPIVTGMGMPRSRHHAYYSLVYQWKLRAPADLPPPVQVDLSGYITALKDALTQLAAAQADLSEAGTSLEMGRQAVTDVLVAMQIPGPIPPVQPG